MNQPQKVVVALSEEEHAKLKSLASISRRTLGRELAFLAFQELAKQSGKRRSSNRPKEVAA